MNLYIVRHGETAWNRQNRFQGSSDLSLSGRGRAQIKELAGRLKAGINIKRIYSSPLKRAYQTADIISKRLGIPVKRRSGLREISLGAWEGRTPREIDRLYNNEYQKWLKLGPSKARIPKAEPLGRFNERVVKAITGIAGSGQKGDAVIVTHGGVIASFLAYLFRTDFDSLFQALYLPNACVVLVNFYKNKGYVLSINGEFPRKRSV
ncbi:MAG: histidine phosphatase family protein [Candidatus Omnitrophota bacterium]